MWSKNKRSYYLLVRAAGSDCSAEEVVVEEVMIVLAPLSGRLQPFLLIFRGLLCFELLGMFTAFVVCASAWLYKGEQMNHPIRLISHTSIYHHGLQSHTHTHNVLSIAGTVPIKVTMRLSEQISRV